MSVIARLIGPPPAPERRAWHPVETRLVAEYLIQEHPNATHLQRVRLGLPPERAVEAVREGYSPRLYYPTLHWADGMALYADRTVLVEGKIKLTPDAVGQLATYADLFDATLEFKDRWGLPLDLECVFAVGDPDTEKILATYGIRPIRFRPTWAEAYYLNLLRKRYPEVAA